MASWNLESVGTKGYGGGGSYFCARAARAFVSDKKNAENERLRKGGIFKDPLMDSCYGQCTSSVRREVRDDIADLIKPNELEEALAMARASCHNEVAHRGEQRSSRSAHADAGSAYEEVKVTFEKTFTSKESRGGKGIPLVCIGTSEHAVYVMRITYNGRKWSVERRYSEFDDLDKVLLKAYGGDSSVRILVLPSKTWVGSLSKELLESRRKHLEAYVQGLVSQGGLVWKCDALRAFLELPPRPPGVKPGKRGGVDAGGGHRDVRGGSVDGDSDSENGMLNL